MQPDNSLKASIFEGLLFICFALLLLIYSLHDYYRFFSVIPIIIITLSIVSIRKSHATEVYILFLTFFVTLYICLSAFIFLRVNSYIHMYNCDLLLPITVGIIADGFNWYMEEIENINVEYLLISFVIGLVILPQTLSFIVSGAFGCGKPPEFVYYLTKSVVLFLIKMFCALAALQAAEILFFSYSAFVDSCYKLDYGVDAFGQPLSSMAVAFMLSTFYFKINIIFDYMRGGERYRVISSISEYMTRFTKR